MSRSACSCLVGHNPWALLTARKKKKKNAIWRISHFHSCSVIFFLLSAVVQPWSSHSGENREKWKQVYVFFLPCVETQHSQRWTQWSSSWSVLWKQNNILIMAQWHIISAANSNYFTIWNSDCWIFPWGWLNHRGDCGEAPSRCQAAESTVQPRINSTFCRIILCLCVLRLCYLQVVQ